MGRPRAAGHGGWSLRARVVPSVVLFALGSSSALAEEPEPEPEPPSASAAPGEAPVATPSPTPAAVNEDPGYRRRAGYLQLSPTSVVFPIPPDHAFALYSWGVSGGYHFPAGKKLLLEVGGFFDDSFATSYYGKDGTLHFMGIGSELRLGGGKPKRFGYGLMRLGLGLQYARYGTPPSNDGPPYGVSEPTGPFTYKATLVTLGGGIQGLLHRHVTMGGELAFDIFVYEYQTEALARLRVFVGILF